MLFAALAGHEGRRRAVHPAGRRGRRRGDPGRAEQPLAGDCPVPVVRVDDPRRALALAAARFYARQPRTVVAVTGTNGKTSVAVFLRQIWEKAGHKAASLGTIGLVAPGGAVDRQPDHARPGQAARDPGRPRRRRGHASRAGSLEPRPRPAPPRRRRASPPAPSPTSRATTSTIIATLEDYLQAKLRLFDTLLPKGAAAVADADQPRGGGGAAHRQGARARISQRRTRRARR